jgi:hypothetical protein
MKMSIFAKLAKARLSIESIKRLRLGGGQACDRSIVWNVVISLSSI